MTLTLFACNKVRYSRDETEFASCLGHVPCLYTNKSIHIAYDLSRDMIFPAMGYVRPAKAQTSLRIRADWPKPLLVT